VSFTMAITIDAIRHAMSTVIVIFQLAGTAID